MTHRWIVTSLGKDRPGIVAGVTEVLYKLGCNLEDSSMTRLEGEFAIMLIFSTSGRLTAEVLRRAFTTLERRLRLTVHLKPLTKPETGIPRKQGSVHLISVYGADRPGIVFKMAQAMARAGINITDVHTHRSAGKTQSLYLLLLEVELPPRRPVAALERHLQMVAKRLGVQCSIRPADAAVL